MNVVAPSHDAASGVKPVRIGMFGLGTVGGGVAKLLISRRDIISREIGRPIELTKVVVRDLHRTREFEVPAELLSTDPDAILENPTIDIVVEVMGGIRPAGEWLRRAIRAGKHKIGRAHV